MFPKFQTRLMDFECSDRTVSKEWDARIDAHEMNVLSERVLSCLDAGSAAPADDDFASIVSPIRTILGISAAEPGFTCVRIAPHPGELIWTKGWVTIPEGIVAVAWERLGSRFILDVSIPVGVHLKAVLPAHHADDLFVNGEPVDPDSQTIRTEHHVELAVLPGSEYRFEVISRSTVR